MSVTVEANTIVVDGVARVEDAEPLANALIASPERTVDLSACTDLNGAVLQVLLVFAPKLVGCVGNPSLDAWLTPLLSPKYQGEAET
ncbi:hypothetical protein [Brevundimonas goettingensis]|uniref:STAS domain-containing protein n=1 Tax=Brevundimonas goettingensis TaxID=2774190 RepID=A0A975C2Y1_9CAUL|nr:hypothetical protein [Brevundimonas goettingensis]QTC92893.1 hypothetical protein IFJ75_08640 [Brevundimonas goettingensis]